MIRQYYEKICAGEQIRANLISLRDAIKDEKERRALAYLLAGEFDVFCSLLQNDDPKIRKNAALILGYMESDDLLPVLYQAYVREKTLFVKSDYLKAISRMEYCAYVEKLSERLETLRRSENAMEDQKHISEEIRVLQNMVMKYQKIRRHKFIGYESSPEVILVTNRCQREATARQILSEKPVMLAGGIRVKSTAMEDLLKIRTWREMLIPMHCMPVSVKEPEKSLGSISSQVLAFMEEFHAGKAPFLFRIELKTKIEPEKRGAYIRKISDGLERISEGKLINSISDYEVEIRFLERKDGTLVPMLKLYTISDKRFAYRRESVAASIAPYNAALAVELAKPYLKENARVLDPFCGVGTMLLERNYAVKAEVLYGVDIFGEAIEKARVNTEHAACVAYYINKDFLDFEHEYLFDEIITNMPMVTSESKRSEVRQLYRLFLDKAGELLKSEAVLVLYTTEPQYVYDALRENHEYTLKEKYILNEKNHTSVFIIERSVKE